MPLIRRVPKFGFRSPFKVDFQTVNVATLEQLVSAGKLPDGTVDPVMLFKLRVVSKKNAPVKILGDGELKSNLKVSAHSFSKSAVLKIEGAGGTAVTVSRAGT